MTTTPSGPPADAFYVGYLPLPARQKRSLRILVPSLVLVFVALAAAFGASQRDPGTGRHGADATRAWTGSLALLPEPVLIDDAGAAMLIVRMGKHGARERLADLDGATVRLSGSLIERSGRRMIELNDADAAIVVVGREGEPRGAIAWGPEIVEFRGEILDAKCWLGAMKPGDGKAHKACATLCVAGGIPPLLFTTDPDGRARQFLLVAAPGASLTDIVLPFIAEPVRVRGSVGRIADLDVLRIGSGSITR